jgi:hypothetical protein
MRAFSTTSFLAVAISAASRLCSPLSSAFLREIVSKLSADIGGFMHNQSDIFALAIGGDDDEPRRVGAIDGRSVEGRRLSAARRAFEREFGDADPVRLREATLLFVGLQGLEFAVAKGNVAAIQAAAKISNSLQRLRREMSASAKHRETESC